MRVLTLSLLFVFTFLNSAMALDLSCKATKKAPSYVKEFIIGNADKIYQEADSFIYRSYLVDGDANQVDPVDIKGIMTIFSLHNGCDNFFEINVKTEEMKSLLSGKTEEVELKLHYEYEGRKNYRGNRKAICKRVEN